MSTPDLQRARACREAVRRLVIHRLLPGLLSGIAALAAAGNEALQDVPAPGLGQPLDPEAVRALDYTVLPDGAGLPPGQGTAAQGRALYRAHCLACHGEGGAGGPNDRLAGGAGTAATHAPVRTVGSYWPCATTVFDYIRRAMPYVAPGSFTGDQVYALTAYLLHENGIIGEEAVMNAETLPRVEMPNREGFVWAVEGE